MRLFALTLALFVTTACAKLEPVAPSPGPWRFSGTVSRVDGATLVPIAGAELKVISGANKDARVVSDGAGRYVFDALDAGRFTVSITAPGYVGITPLVALFQDVDANFALKPAF